MKKQKLIFGLSLLSCAGLLGCFPFGTKDALIAKVGDEKIYQSDVDFVRMSSPQHGKLEKKSQILANLISSHEFFSEAKKKLGNSNKDVEKKMDALRERMLTRIYQEIYLIGNLGHSDDQIQSYYKSHPELFAADSCFDYIECREKIAKSLYLSENKDSLNAFLTERLRSYQKPASVDVAYFISQDSLQAKKVESSFAAGTSLDSIPGLNRQSFSADSKDSLFQYSDVYDYFFGKKHLNADGSFKFLQIKRSQKMDPSTSFFVFKILSRHAAESKTLEEVRPSLEQAFVDSYKDKQIHGSEDSLRIKYKVTIEKIVPPEPRKYYETHQDEFKTLPAYSVYHVQSSDSVALAKGVAGATTLDAFKALAREVSSNDSTKAYDGFVGKVEKSHPLPYGIGMMPKLFDEFAGKEHGAISSVMQAPNTGLFQVFYLDSSYAESVMPFERVEAKIKAMFSSGSEYELDSSYVLAKSKGAPFVYERDIIALRNEIPEQERYRYSRDILLKYLIGWKVFAKEAGSVDIEKSQIYKAFVTNTRVSIYNSIYMDSLMAGSYGLSEAQIRNGYKKYGSSFFDSRSLEDVHSQLALFLSVPELVMRHEYYLNPIRYASYANYDSAKFAIFKMIVNPEKRNWLTRYKAELSRKAKVNVYDTTYLPLIDEYSRSVLEARADSLYKNRKLPEARATWERLRTLYPENDSLYSRATFEIAKISNENENYFDAEREYAAFYAMWPSSPEAEKALFSRAFIMHENLKKDTVALGLFQEFQQKYPKSDLAESVDWLIRNIQSNGKLAEELLEKISKQDEKAE